MLQVQISSGFISAIIIAAAIAIIVLAVFLLVFFITSRNRQNKLVLEKLNMEQEFEKQLMQSQIEVQEYTSAALSREIHDNIGQLLSSTKLLLGITAMEMQTVPDTLKTAEESLSKAIHDLRSLSKSLDKEWLHQFNLVENLEAEKDRINAAKTIKVELISQYQNTPLEPDAQILLFRVVQEALQNSLKHASPHNIIIQIKGADNYLELCIEDDGSGFDIANLKRQSLGIKNMESRVGLLGGTIEWNSKDGSGTIIKILIPV